MTTRSNPSHDKISAAGVLVLEHSTGRGTVCRAGALAAGSTYMTKLFFLICIEVPAVPAAERIETLRDEIQQHAAAVVPFFTHQEPSLVTCQRCTSETLLMSEPWRTEVKGAA